MADWLYGGFRVFWVKNGLFSEKFDIFRKKSFKIAKNRQKTPKNAKNSPPWGGYHEANFHKNEVFGRFAVANQNFIHLKKC
jgi:hypothetical protein